MTEADLARPIIEVKDFLTGELAYEMYTFGEQTVVVPIKDIKVGSNNVARKIAGDVLKEKIKKELPAGTKFDLKMTSDNRVEILVPERMIGELIGKNGSNIKKLEDKIGIRIDVREGESKDEPIPESKTEAVDYKLNIGKKRVEIILGEGLEGMSFDIEVDKKYVTTATSSKKGVIKISTNSDAGKKLLFAKRGNQEIKVLR
jgi:ATPase